MANNPKNIDNLVVPQKGEIRNPNGRPKKSFSLLNAQLIDEGYEIITKAQYVEAYTLMMSLDEAKIKEIATDRQQPLFLRLIIKELTNAETSGKTIIDIRNYVFGQAMQESKSTIVVIEQPLFPDVPAEQ